MFFLKEELDQYDGDQGHRDIDVEDPAPGQNVDDPAPEQGPQDSRGREKGRHHAQNLQALVRIRIQVRIDDIRQGDHPAVANSRDQAEKEQKRHRISQPLQQRPQEKHGRGQLVGQLVAAPLAQFGPQGRGHRGAQQEDGDQPARIFDPVQVSNDARQRRVDDCVVQPRHHVGQHQG